MKALRHAACVLFAALSLLASPAHATSFTTDQSDLYYIVTEQGWGMQLVQRGSVIFATLFIYGPTGEPTWYTATLDYTSNLTWTGQLIATTGTYFGSPWNPGALTVNAVGTMTWQAPLVNGGTLTYVVDGVTVVKNVTRQELVSDDYSGHYAGGFHGDFTGCVNPAINGIRELVGTTDVTQNGTALLVTTSDGCVYTGTLSEAGQMGFAQMSLTCPDGTVAAVSFDQMQVTPFALSGAFAATYSNAAAAGCQSSGWFGGFRVTTF
jgi:hypothetical protein